MAGSAKSPTTDTTCQTLSSLTVATPGDLKESIHAALFDDLPRKVADLDVFQDCRITFYQKYRVVLITAEGLGVDMDHRGNDINYFQAPSSDIPYSDTEVEYIGKRKAEQYQSWGTVSLFTTIWTDLVEELAGLKRGTDLLYP